MLYLRRTTLVALCAAVCFIIPATCSGQTEQGGPPENTRWRFGPLFVNPSIALTNLGKDNNVFNEPDQLQPKSDFTFTLTPAADLWLRVGRSWLSSKLKEDLVWYQTYENQRAANENFSLRWTMPMTRLKATAGVSFVDALERPGYEIDARSQRTEVAYDGALEYRLLSKTFLGVKASTKKVDFDSLAEFEGVNLRQVLNRRENSGGLTVRYQMTPLTSLVFEGLREDDRFDTSPARDSDSTLATAAVQFDPLALLKGSARFGYRDFKPLSPVLPGYSGLVLGVDLTYILQGSTKLNFSASRDVQYSFELLQPYYLQTGFNASVSQQIYGPMDAVGRVGIQNLHYQQTIDSILQDRADKVYIVGGGVGYHMSNDVRIGFNIDNQRRTSTVPLRAYDGLRFGFTVTFGVL